MRLSPWEWPKVGRGAAKYQFKKMKLLKYGQQGDVFQNPDFIFWMWSIKKEASFFMIKKLAQ